MELRIKYKSKRELTENRKHMNSLAEKYNKITDNNRKVSFTEDESKELDSILSKIEKSGYVLYSINEKPAKVLMSVQEFLEKTGTFAPSWFVDSNGYRSLVLRIKEGVTLSITEISEYAYAVLLIESKPRISFPVNETVTGFDEVYERIKDFL